MVEQYENNFSTQLNGAIDDDDTTLTVDAVPVNMTGGFRIRIENEIIRVGAVSGSTFTGCTRGAEGTTATSHADNTPLSHVLTAEALKTLGATYIDGIEAAAPGTPSSGTARLYVKSDGRWYSKDDGGTEYGPFSAAGGGGSDYIATITGESGQLYYWPLNETSGTSYNEVNGGTDLANAGATPAAVGGPALQKDVNGGSIGIYSSAQRVTRTAITWPAQWTIEAWVALPRTGQTSGCLFGQWNGSGAMVFATGTDIRFYLNGSFGTWAATAAASMGRHHVLIGYDGTNCKGYWDGVEKASDARTALGTNVGGEFALGSYSSGGGAGEIEFIGDVAFYNTFDSGRAAAHYALGA